MQGHLMAIDRHGINRVESGPLLRCSFEETVDMLMDAATYAEEEVLRGVTENIMLGQLARVGTGDMELLLDEKRVMRDAVEVVANEFGDGTDLGMTGGSLSGGTASPYSSTPFAASPMIGMGGEMSPFSDGGGGFSPSVGGSSFSPAYSPSSGSYGSGFASGSYGSDGGSSSPYVFCVSVVFLVSKSNVPSYIFQCLFSCKPKLFSNKSRLLSNESSLQSNLSCLLSNFPSLQSD